MWWFVWISAFFAGACLSKDIDLRRNIPIILSPQCQPINPHRSQFRQPYSILISIPIFPSPRTNGFLPIFSGDVPSINCQRGLDRAWWLRGTVPGDGGSTKWKEMEFLVSNINISRNVPNCWKVAFTNGEKISKGGEKPLFWPTTFWGLWATTRNLSIAFDAEQ